MTVADEATKERIKEALAAQETPTVTVLSSLLAAHDELGYLPDAAIEEVAALTDASINDVWGVATFYTNFRFSPPADHAVEVCWGPTCHILGATAIMQRCMEEMGLNGEGDSGDGRVSLRYNSCLGACSRAPVVSIDHRLHGGVTPESVSQRLAALGGLLQRAHLSRGDDFHA